MAASRRKIGVKPSPRRKRAEPKPGKETWEVVFAPNGQVLRETPYGEGPALLLAQGLAQTYTNEVELVVRVRSLFGRPDPLYRVLRCEDGSISTYRL